VTYRYPVVCVSCSWSDANEDEEPSAPIGVEHLAVCEARDPVLHVPLWSIGWPYYWAVQNGEAKADAFTFEVGWLTQPSHAKHGPVGVQTGMSAKEFYFFPTETNRRLYGVVAA
jgi:hypothetical protein